MKLLLVANPAASGFSGASFRKVTEVLSTSYQVEHAWPASAAGVSDAVGEAAAAGVEVVAAMGGDGVAHLAARALEDSNTALALIPAGTTNVLARILGIPDDPVAAARILTDDPVSAGLAMALLEGHGRWRRVSARATFAAGVGLDADIVRIAEAEPFRKHRFGAIHYLRTSLATALGDYVGKPANLRVSDGDRRVDGVAVLIQVHGIYTYFGPIPLRLAPPSPSSMAVLVVERLDMVRIPSIVARAISGRSLRSVDGITVWSGVERLLVEAEPATTAQADGETLGPLNHLEATYRADALRVLVPRRR